MIALPTTSSSNQHYSLTRGIEAGEIVSEGRFSSWVYYLLQYKSDLKGMMKIQIKIIHLLQQ